jgi:phosphate transport system permease protein
MASTVEIMQRSLKRRYAAERRFRLYGALSILVALLFLVFLFGAIVSNGYSGFLQTRILLPITLSTEHFEASTGGGDITEALRGANYNGIIKDAMRGMFPHVTKRGEKRALTALVSPGAADVLRQQVMQDPGLVGSSMELWLPVDDDVDMYIKGHFDSETSATGRLTGQQAAWVDGLRNDGRIQRFFNTGFFTTGDSREPELAGIGGALMGTFLTLLVTLVLSFPIGVGAAVYLEEFAPKNRWTDLIEVNINNLAAVPSIVFGLLGLAVFIGFFGTPRSAPITGGFVLTLMTLPTIIISSRAVLKSVPPSIREAALGVGASRVQMMFHHVLPQALPGMLTGTIIGMSQALGESAPLLMIGMVAFIVDVPAGFFDPSTVLPVQIFLWADSPERAFVERTSAAILVLLGFLVLMNATAIYLRKRFEKQW